MNEQQKECGRCPAFLLYPETVAAGLCYGCQQPPAQFIATDDGRTIPRFEKPKANDK